MSTFWIRIVVLFPTSASKRAVGAPLNRITVSWALIAGPCLAPSSVPLFPTTAHRPNLTLSNSSVSGRSPIRSGSATSISSMSLKAMIEWWPHEMSPRISTAIWFSVVGTLAPSSSSSRPLLSSTILETFGLRPRIVGEPASGVPPAACG